MLGKPFYDLDLWPVTLIFKVNPDIIQVDPWPKFGDLRTIGLAPGSLEVKCVGALKERNKERNKETRGKLKGRALHWPKYRNLSLCINKVLIISTLFFSVLPVVCQGNKKPLFTFVVLEVGRFKVLELERIYRIAPAVTDCHCETCPPPKQPWKSVVIQQFWTPNSWKLLVLVWPGSFNKGRSHFGIDQRKTRYFSLDLPTLVTWVPNLRELTKYIVIPLLYIPHLCDFCMDNVLKLSQICREAPQLFASCSFFLFYCF